MSEKLHNSSEKHRSAETAHLEHETNHQPSDRESSHSHKEASGLDLETIKKRIDQEALAGRDVEIEQIPPEHSHPSFINKDLKEIAFKKTLGQARRNLSQPERVFSNIIHQPLVEKA